MSGYRFEPVDECVMCGSDLSHRLRATDYVTNLSPRHPPYHLCEFTPESFERHGKAAGYRVVSHRVLPCARSHLPRPIAPVVERIMQRTDTGLELQVWLQAALPTR